MDPGEASAAQLSGRRMQHGDHSTLRAGTQGNGGIGVVPKPAAAQSIPPLLLDLDGTLVDSAHEHVMAWREALEESEIRLPNWKIHLRIGMSGKLFPPALLRELGRKTGKAEIQSIEKNRASIFRKKIPEIRMQRGTKDLLQVFEKIGAGWAMATSGARWQVKTDRRRKKKYQGSRPSSETQTHHSPSARIDSHRARKARRESRQTEALLMTAAAWRKPLQKASPTK